MKSLFSHATVLAAISLFTGLPLFGQTTPVAATSPPANRSSNSAAEQDAKEKAEDATLLQQLDAGAASADTDYKPKDQWVARGRGAGGARAGVAPVPYTMQNILTRPAGAVKPLLVRTSDPDPKTQAALEEDLSVMAHILGKTIDEIGAQASTMKAMGIDVFFTPGSSPLRSLYLDNYGAVFFLGVNFPLIAPSEKRVEEKPTGDSDWEDARQELYGQRSQGALAGEPTESYSEEKVQKLKEKLLEALKNAANIRELKADEFVTLWVSGGASAGAGRVRAVRANPPGGLGGNMIAVDQVGFPSRRTIMTIRVSKNEIDAYAKGKLTLEEFRKHVRITAYTGDSTGFAADGLMVGGFGGRARFQGP